MGRRPRERVRRGPSLFEVLLNHLVLQRAGEILQHAYTRSNTHGLFLFRRGEGVASGIACPSFVGYPLPPPSPPPSHTPLPRTHPPARRLTFPHSPPPITLVRHVALPPTLRPQCPALRTTPTDPPFSVAPVCCPAEVSTVLADAFRFPAPLRRVASSVRLYVVLATNILIWHTVVGLSIAVAGAFLFPHEL